MTVRSRLVTEKQHPAGGAPGTTILQLPLPLHTALVGAHVHADDGVVDEALGGA